MDAIHLEIFQNGSKYSSFIVIATDLIKTDFKKQKKVILLHIDGIQLHYIIRELHLSGVYRENFISHYQHSVRFVLIPARSELIDYNWNCRMEHLVRERCELEHTLSWLSTLGGAFSALGDYFAHCAEMAGKISVNQLKLGLRLGDPSVVARCRLFFSLSLIQRHYFKLAKRVVYNEYVSAKRATVIDTRLLRMCQGIWAKLQYEFMLYKQCRKLKKIKFK